MGIFNDFNKKEKPVFTGLKFGFGSGPTGPTGPTGPSPFTASGGNAEDTSTRSGYTLHIFTNPGI